MAIHMIVIFSIQIYSILRYFLGITQFLLWSLLKFCDKKQLSNIVYSVIVKTHS